MLSFRPSDSALPNRQRWRPGSWQAAEKLITIHEITRSSTKSHERGAVFLLLFGVRSCDFVDRAGFFDLYILFSSNVLDSIEWPHPVATALGFGICRLCFGSTLGTLLMIQWLASPLDQLMQKIEKRHSSKNDNRDYRVSLFLLVDLGNQVAGRHIQGNTG